MNLATRIRSTYSTRDNHIVPFIGQAFEHPSPNDMRVVIVGINSYVSPKDWDQIKPEWFGSWVVQAKFPFYRGVKAQSLELASALVEKLPHLTNLNFAWPGSLYATNAIKTYLPEAEGKKSEQVPPEMFAEHASTWRQEVDLLAEHGALPNLIVIFGAQFWPHACASFKPPHSDNYKHLRVLEYQHATGPCLRFANRLTLQGANGRQTTLLVRLRHPSARTNVGSARWLLAQEEFWTLARR